MSTLRSTTTKEVAYDEHDVECATTAGVAASGETRPRTGPGAASGKGMIKGKLDITSHRVMDYEESAPGIGRY